MGKKSSGGPSKAARNNRANQLNPNNAAYHSSRGSTPKSAPSTGQSEAGSAKTNKTRDETS